MADYTEQIVKIVKSRVPSYGEAVKYAQQCVHALKNASFQDVVDEFSKGQITPLTVSVAVTTVGTLVVLSLVLGGSGSASKKSKKKAKKKLSPTQKANRDIQAVLDYVESEFVPEIDKYVEDPQQYLAQDREYKYKYFEEMLLKQLMKLDGIDVSGNDTLRENRKKVIRFIQDHQKRLDKVKKDLKF